MYTIAPEVVSIADACLGGLNGRSALVIGSEEQRYAYVQLLRRAKMKYVYEEEATLRVSSILPHVQLLICIPSPGQYTTGNNSSPLVTAAMIAKGCEGRHTPLLIFDLAPSTSVEELAGLLPAVCLYTPQDLRHVLGNLVAKAS